VPAGEGGCASLNGEAGALFRLVPIFCQRAVASVSKPSLVDVHIVTGCDAGVLPGPVSAVMSTRVKPGSAHRAWARRIAAAQSKAPGFQGHRFEAPIPGVQDHWLSIVRFDTEANL
jgi:hypothetical protein